VSLILERTQILFFSTFFFFQTLRCCVMRMKIVNTCYEMWLTRFYRAKCIAQSLLSTGVRPSVNRLFVRQSVPSHWCIVSKRLNLPSNVFHRLVPHHSSCSVGDPTVKFRRGHPPTWAPNRDGVPKICDFQPIPHFISESIRDRARVTMDIH